MNKWLKYKEKKSFLLKVWVKYIHWDFCQKILFKLIEILFQKCISFDDWNVIITKSKSEIIFVKLFHILKDWRYREILKIREFSMKIKRHLVWFLIWSYESSWKHDSFIRNLMNSNSKLLVRFEWERRIKVPFWKNFNCLFWKIDFFSFHFFIE
jgi:hypothetical protein